MKSWQKWVLGIAVVAIGLGVLGYLNRSTLILALVEHRAGQEEIAPNRPTAWSQGPAEAELPSAERPPNIVFILFDDLGINDLSTFGGGVAGGTVPTPNIDRLAAEGAIFTQAYSGSATCAVSRAQLMKPIPTRTGFEYTPTRSGFGRVVAMVGNDIRGDLPPYEYNADAEVGKPDYDDMGLPSEEVTIAEVLREQGYHNVHIGKWHLGTGDGFHPLDQGFDESLVMTDLMHLPEDDPDVVNARIDFDPIDNFLWASGRYGTTFNKSEKFAPGGYLADYWTDQAERVIENNRNRPFFLYLAHWGVHTPLQATREDYEAVGDIQPHRLRVYAAMVRSLDRSVGRVMAKLEEQGIADNTIIVISSDNGGAGYIGVPEVNAPYRGFKINFFEGGIRVPIFARWPARIAAGTRIDMPAAHVDLMPTFAAIGGGNVPAEIPIDGRDLLPALTGSGEMERPDAPLFWNSGYYKVVRAGDWKLQVDGKQDRRWLFDLANDPTEQVNLVSRNPDKLAELEALLAAHHKDRRPALYPTTTDSPIMIDKTLAEQFEDGDEYIYWPN